MSVVPYKNKILKKIVNVYQLKYKNGIAQGFGDFINGSFFLLQLCIKFNLEFDMDLSNHPISKYFYPNKTNNIIPGYKSKYTDEENKLSLEISVYDEKYKEYILKEHQSKFNLPIYIIIVLKFLKVLHYNLGILPIYYYSRFKKYLTNNLYDNNKAEFIVLDF